MTLANEYHVILDTCVLAPMPLADTFLRMAEEPGMFVPHWSAHILAELHGVLLRFGYTEAQADRRIGVMRRHFEEAEITGYEQLISSMTNEVKDRHVLAAAVRIGALAIVTQNLKDFPASSVEPYGIDVVSPDDFLVHKFHVDSRQVMEKIHAQGRCSPQGLEGLLRRLRLVTPRFVALVTAAH